jgi:UDP-2,3-diacylglucosamine hydrolase
LHLQTEEPAITAGFLRFTGEARQADALYILGDLFEAWIGDDDPNPLHRQIASALKALAESGVPCYFSTATAIFSSVSALPAKAP